ncbi:hypothetical protein Poli38472_014050 [Pythium oligandrum]|uniref:Uncharacterized protein n=1 Tax=Pythium oligandrum TaxID=41045 RepID=A0A8K1CPP4_PYTOL|nr:hypothetical protein Poli38472_014050 [Pythium oligandrum]|eukprot:TMW66738.1 hypothetical protein Poli38472_014050 [Pythium oligandrum]
MRHHAHPPMPRYPPPPRLAHPPPPTAFYAARPRPRPLPPVDPEEQWLAAFKRQHLSDPEPVVTTLTGPPLQAVRLHLTEIESLVDDLEHNATELLTHERRLDELLTSEDDDENSLEVSRLRLQIERERSRCAQIQAAITAKCSPGPLGLSKEMAEAITAFARRAQKKKRWRQRAKARLQAARAVRRGLEEGRTDSREQSIQSPSIEEAATPRTSNDISGSTQAAEATSAASSSEEKVTAKKLLLAVELLKKRRGDSLTAEEQHAIDTAQREAEARLHRRKRQKKPRSRSPKAFSEEINSEKTTQTQDTTSTHAQTVSRPLLQDPACPDMEALVATRRHWDRYIVHPAVQGASSIPPHFVIPPVHPSDMWSVYLTTETS